MNIVQRWASSRISRLLLFLFVVAIARRVTYTIDAVRDISQHYTRAPFWLNLRSPRIAGIREGEEQLSSLRAGDRLVAVDGRAVAGYQDAVVPFHGIDPNHEVPVSFEREGKTRQILLKPAVVSFGGNIFALGFGALSWIVMPWFSVLLGFWVAALRPRDPRAWMVLGILLGIAEFTSAPVLDPRGWSGIGSTLLTYADLAPAVWAASMLLFGVYFPQRWSLDRRFPWAKWILLVPLTGLALWTTAQDVAPAIDFAFARRWFPQTPLLSAILQTISIIAPCFFFMGISIKFSDPLMATDDRRRLRLLYWGVTAGLGPMFLLILYTLIVFHRMPNDNEELFLGPAIMGYLIVPLTMAYVLVVQRAMDVRMVVRQGVQYALARRGVRVIQGCLAAGVVILAVTLSDSHASRPQKVTLIALGVVLILRIRDIGEKLRGWVDRRFFREAYNAEQILHELSEQVRSILDTKSLLDTVTRKISESLHVDRIAVMLQDGAVYRSALATGYAGSLDHVVFAADGPAVSKLRASREPLVIDEAAQDGLTALSPQLLLPLSPKRDLLGFISLGPKKSEEPYSPSDTSLLKTVAAQTGLALENSRLTADIASQMAQREVLEREIEIAREVQQRLFPQNAPIVTTLQYAGHCRPARGVGGDYYDFLALEGGWLGIAIADISGKGIPAALLMASLQASVRGQSQSSGSGVARLMSNVNQLVYDASPSNRYATFFYAQFDPVSRRMVYTNGGHNPPMVIRGQQVIRLETGGPPVGLFRPALYEQDEVQLEPGDLLVMFTDGISEAENEAHDEWGEDALIATARACDGLPPAEMIPLIMAAADAFAAGAPQHDDMTVVIARVT